MSKGIKFEKKDGSKLRIGIVASSWNSHITDALLSECQKALQESGVPDTNVVVYRVPGAYEVIYGTKKMIEKENVDAVVCLGSLIKGETMHFEYIAEAVTQGIASLNIEAGVPVIFGVLACLNEEQAIVRSQGEKNQGHEWGMAAVEMGLLKNK